MRKENGFDHEGSEFSVSSFFVKFGKCMKFACGKWNCRDSPVK